MLALGERGGVPEPFLDVPLRERRARLEALVLGPGPAEGGRFGLSRLSTAGSGDDLEEIFVAARARRNEGLMVKDPSSAYSPGRRGYGWLKMKKALATLDCVVVGVEVGHGKRHGVLSDYTFAVRDEASGRLVTIGKAYSGLTDAEIADMTRWFEAHTISSRGRYREVEPMVVVEVAFDVIMRSRTARVRVCPALPADRPPAHRQGTGWDRHAGDGRPALARAAARRRAPGWRRGAVRRTGRMTASESCAWPHLDSPVPAGAGIGSVWRLLWSRGLRPT